MPQERIEIMFYGKVVSSSRNLRGLRRYCGKHTAKNVAIERESNGTGTLLVEFWDRTWCRVEWASYNVLKWSLRNWRNLYGVSLFANGENVGEVSYKNEALQEN